MCAYDDLVELMQPYVFPSAYQPSTAASEATSRFLPCTSCGTNVNPSAGIPESIWVKTRHKPPYGCRYEKENSIPGHYGLDTQTSSLLSMSSNLPCQRTLPAHGPRLSSPWSLESTKRNPCTQTRQFRQHPHQHHHEHQRQRRRVRC
jgi:hypothetical protein